MKKRIRVVCAVIEKEGKILIASRLYGNMAGKWEFPGGKYEAGESGEEAIKREIREEMEMEIEVRERFCTVEHDYPEFHLSMDCYLCSMKEETFRLHDHSAVCWISSAEEKIDFADADVKVYQAYRDYLKERLSVSPGK